MGCASSITASQAAQPPPRAAAGPGQPLHHHQAGLGSDAAAAPPQTSHAASPGADAGERKGPEEGISERPNARGLQQLAHEIQEAGASGHMQAAVAAAAEAGGNAAVAQAKEVAQCTADGLHGPASQLSAAGAADAVQEGVEERIRAAEELRERWLQAVQGGVEGGAEEFAGEVDLVVDAVEGIITFGRKIFGLDKEALKPGGLQDIQQHRTWLERKFARHSALGQILVDMAGPAMEAFPFGPPAAALLGVVYARTAQAAKLSGNCQELLSLLRAVDTQLARVMDAIVNMGARPEADVEGGLQQLLKTLMQGERIMRDYTSRGFILRFIMSKGDERRFRDLDRSIRDAMQWTSFCVSMSVLACGYLPDTQYVPDESGRLRSAVCKAAQLPEDQADEALRQLRARDPECLRKLLQQHGTFSDQVFRAELDVIDQRLGVLEEQMEAVQGVLLVQGGKIEQLQHQLLMAASRQEQQTLLAGFLRDWWQQVLGKKARKAPLGVFCQKLVQWFRDNDLLNELLEYEAELEKEGLANVVTSASKKVCVEAEGRHLNFLSLIVLPLLDLNNDDCADRSELLGLQVTAENFAKKVGEASPQSWPELLDVIWQGVDLEAMVSRAANASNPVLEQLENGMQVRTIIQDVVSAIHALLEAHEPGTREWLFQEANAWLDNAISTVETHEAHHRMFLLLAEPGMGKSVFSAVAEKQLVVHAFSGQVAQVRHFWKVGEPRGQGKAMALSLALQLAEQVPYLATSLKPVVEAHGSAADLTLKDAFAEYLLRPLKDLDDEIKGQRHPPLVTVMLLDALDEASDGNAGFEPVASLIAKEFLKLPPWVKLILTGRPQVAPLLTEWQPKRICPDNASNLADMRLLLEARLKRGSYVEPQDAQAAADMLLKKSQGQFIWVKYAFDQLSTKAEGSKWTLQEMEEKLPSGRSGVFRHVMGTIEDALQSEQPELRTVLRTRLLPVVVAACVPLTPDQLASLASAEKAQVSLLLRLLTNLFPVSTDASTPKVHPYHKSVLDWLVDPKGGGIEPSQGHTLLGSSCYTIITQAAQSYSHALAAKSINSSSSSSKDGDLATEYGLLDALLAYALRYGITHLLLAPDMVDRLEQLVLDFVYFWPAVFAAGWGQDALRMLLGHPLSQASPVIHDVLRWLRFFSACLVRSPKGALQYACDAPQCTIVSKHANQLPQKPQAKLLTKEDDWSPLLCVMQGHACPVNSLAVSGNTIVSGSGYLLTVDQDNTVRVWDQASGDCQAILEGHEQVVNSVAISADGRTCVSGSFDDTVRFWDLSKGECKAVLKGHDKSVTGVAITADGRTCVSGSWDATIKVWDLSSGNCERTLTSHTKVCSLAMSPNGKACVTGADDGSLGLWDLAGSTCKKLEGEHISEVHCVAMSDDGSRCISAASEKRARVWDTSDGRCIVHLGHERMVQGAAISPDGQRGLTSSVNVTRLWDLDTGACVAAYEDHADVFSAAFGSDGRTCVTGSKDGALRSWDLTTGQLVKESDHKGHTKKINEAAVGADGKTCATASEDGTVRVWDLTSGQSKATLAGHSREVRCVAISADGKTCVSGSYDNSIRLWDAESGECKMVLEGHSNAVMSISMSTDGRTCASGSFDRSVRTWDLQTGESKKLEGHTADVYSVALSPDGATCVSGSRDQTLRVWDLRAGGECKAVLKGHSFMVLGVAINPADGNTCISASADRTVRTWDLAAGRELDSQALFSPEGQKLVALLKKWRMGLAAINILGETQIQQSGDGSRIVCDWGVTAAQQSTVYLPPMRQCEHVIFSKPCHTLSLFTEQLSMMCFRVL